MSQLFDKFDANLLITAIVLVCWKTITWRRHKHDGHNHHNKISARVSLFGDTMSVWIPGAAMLTQASLVAFFFLFVKYTINTSYWTFPVVYSLFVASMLMTKSWNALHYRMGAHGASRAVNVIVFLFAVAITVIIAADNTTNLGAEWYIPFALFMPYMLATLGMTMRSSGFKFAVILRAPMMSADFDLETITTTKPQRMYAQVGAAAAAGARAHSTPIPV